MLQVLAEILLRLLSVVIPLVLALSEPSLGLRQRKANFRARSLSLIWVVMLTSYAIAGRNIFQEAGCNQTSLDAQIACLKAVPAVTLNDFANVARYVVQDGTFVNTEQLDVSNKNGSTAFVPTMFGTCRNDGASIGSTYPTTPVTSEVAGIKASLGISEYFAQDIINSGLFPFYNTGNLTLDAFNVSQRVSTDRGFHCIDQGESQFLRLTFSSLYWLWHMSENQHLEDLIPENT
jgi:hypothetical protein